MLSAYLVCLGLGVTRGWPPYAIHPSLTAVKENINRRTIDNGGQTYVVHLKDKK
jgi:hypothetical protein